MTSNNHIPRLWFLKVAIRTLLMILAAREGVNASILAVDDIGGAGMALMKWDGTSWIQLETIGTIKDETYGAGEI